MTESEIITMSIDDSRCKNVDEKSKLVSIKAVTKHMHKVTSVEIDNIQEKIFYVYNNYRNDSETNKLFRVKRKMMELHPDFKWSAVIIQTTAHSIAHHKFFTFQVECKYVIGLAGIKCG